MALDSNVFNGIDEQAPSRLAQIFDPTVIQARNIQQSQMRWQEHQLQRASKLQEMLSGPNPGGMPGRIKQLSQGGLYDEASKLQGLEDSQRQRQEAAQQRQAQEQREWLGRH